MYKVLLAYNAVLHIKYGYSGGKYHRHHIKLLPYKSINSVLVLLHRKTTSRHQYSTTKGCSFESVRWDGTQEDERNNAPPPRTLRRAAERRHSLVRVPGSIPSKLPRPRRRPPKVNTSTAFTIPEPGDSTPTKRAMGPRCTSTPRPFPTNGTLQGAQQSIVDSFWDKAFGQQ